MMHATTESGTSLQQLVAKCVQISGVTPDRCNPIRAGVRRWDPAPSSLVSASPTPRGIISANGHRARWLARNHGRSPLVRRTALLYRLYVWMEEGVNVIDPPQWRRKMIDAIRARYR